jgi:hypothetical protein
MADLLYVYSVVPRGIDVAGAPAGLDYGRVSLLIEGDIAAVVSAVDSTYADGLDERLADVRWLGPRAAAHDAVLTWASDAGPVVPLPLLSLFRSEDAVRAMLRERHGELTSLMDYVGRGREYGVRVFRIDEELRAALAELSEAVHGLEREVAAASSPGQSYLLGRKLETAKKDELRRLSRDVASGALDALSSRSIAAVEDPLPAPSGDHVGIAVLNASFLVAHDRVDEFRGAVTELVQRHHGRGFRVEFTGPWPPYHFARRDSVAATNAPRVSP